MVDHTRHHKVPSSVKLEEAPETGLGVYTEDIMDGMEKIKAVGALVESVIIWRAQYIAWNVDIFKAEPLLVRLIYKEGSQNPKAMDLLARIYFQQSKYERAKDLWNRATALQPGNPALKRTANAMNAIAQSPTAAVVRHKIAVMLRGCFLIALLCVMAYGAMLGVKSLQRWMEGPIAVQNLSGRFTYAYDSITKDMVYVPEAATKLRELAPDAAPITSESDGTYSLGFTRRKVASNKEAGRIEVTVERVGDTLKASGRIPNLYTRYLVEQALWGVPGVMHVDMRNLVVDRTYRVNRGDSLWIIAKRMLGDGKAWTVLAKENDLSDPNRLRIGQELNIPLGDEYLDVADETFIPLSPSAEAGL